MGRCQVMLVVDFAVGRPLALEPWSIPRGETGLYLASSRWWESGDVA